MSEKVGYISFEFTSEFFKNANYLYLRSKIFYINKLYYIALDTLLIALEFEEEDIEALPAVVVLEDSSEKESKIIAQEDWGDSTQELHLQSISNSLNQINSLNKMKMVMN